MARRMYYRYEIMCRGYVYCYVNNAKEKAAMIKELEADDDVVSYKRLSRVDALGYVKRDRRILRYRPDDPYLQDYIMPYFWDGNMMHYEYDDTGYIFVHI